ncbi:MAG: stalk domain-containing protein [Bacillota bacterium]
MIKKLLSLSMAAILIILVLAPGAFANTGANNTDQQNVTITENVYQSVTGSVYGDENDDEDEDDKDKRGKKGHKLNNGKHKGIPNALTHVKNPRARAVLQAILEGRSVSEAVYRYKMELNTDIDPDEVQTVANEVYGGLSRDNQLSSQEKAITFRYMAQIHIKAGKASEALKYMEYSARSNPDDEETFRELDRLHAGKKNMMVKVYVNGKSTDFDVLPKIVEGRTLVPVRFIAEGLNANISYNGDTGTVTVQGPRMSVKMKINSRTALVNGREVQLDVPATVENGRTIVPLRFISENFKCKVKFYGESNLVTVNSQ